MKDKMSIEELAESVNNSINGANPINYNDSRISKNLSVRRIRDYVSKGILDKPSREGKNVFFNEEHFDKLIEVRTLQNSGVSEKLYTSLSASSTDQIDNYSKAQDIGNLINDIKAQSHIPERIEISDLFSGSNSNMLRGAPQEEEIIKKIQWNEYQLDMVGDVILKTKSNLVGIDKDEILKNINKILNQKGKQ
jgi:DNA-binding transcriptional MerR regulator